MTVRTKPYWGGITTILVALIVLVIIDQVRYLFVYPVPDTGMWFGDETWTMLTLRDLATSGVARVPEAIGSSLAHSNGFINGSVWLSGILYGLPAALFRSVLSPVAMGRIVTMLLALISVVVVYRLTRSLQTLPDAALLGIFALVTSPAFYFSSHAARLYMATGLAILLFFWLLLAAFDAPFDKQVRFAFLVPVIAVISLAVYVHVPALIAIPALYTLWRTGNLRTLKGVATAFAGFAFGAILMVGVYWLSTGSISLLGYGYNQYYNVATSLPVLHLLSWRVQKINTIDRLIQVWDVAWPIVIALVAGIVTRIRTKAPLSRRERFLMINTLLLLFSWGLFGGPAVFYNIYVLPVTTVCASILLMPALPPTALDPPRGALLITLVILLAGYAVLHQERFGAVGARLTTENARAIHALIDPVASAVRPPLVLTDEPAINVMAGDPNVRLMTNHLLLFGYENLPLDQILKEHHVNYLLLYSTVRWHSPFRHLADSLYVLQAERTGTLTDQARTYENPDWNEIDTLRLYKVQ